MKTILLSIAFMFIYIASSYAQSVTIFVDGQTTDISGSTQVAPELTTSVTNEHLIDFIINNNTGASQDWVITRLNVTNPAGWSANCCWAPNPGVGLCYQTGTDAVWSSPAETIPNGGSGKLNTYVNAPTAGSATYRYYVSTDGLTYLDSVDVEINSTLSISENETMNLRIAPNPSSDYFVVSAANVEGGTIKIVDVLGNIILDEKLINSSKKVSVSNYRNGVYFVTVNSNNNTTSTRKIIVQH